MEDMLTRSLGTGVKVVTQIDAETWDIAADQSQVENALLNLSINARDAMDKGGTLTIATGNVTFGPQRPPLGELEAGDYVCLSVGDTGSGIPPEVLQHVLEPFFTTKETGKGTGLGLSMVYGFVNQSGGHMEIESEVGTGTTMLLYFPRAMEQIDDQSADTGEPEPKGKGEMVLLIESAEGVRELTQTFLEELDYKVIEATDADEAYALLDSGAFPLAAILTEIQLPGAEDGLDVARRIQAEFPGIKLAFMSASNDDRDPEEIALQDIPCLAKPFVRGDLAQVMRSALQQTTDEERRAG